MLSKSILEFVSWLIGKFMDITGLPVDIIPDWLGQASTSVLNVVEKGVGMLSWLFPNKTVYTFLINTTLDLFSAMLVFELFAIFLRFYNHVKK